MKTGKQNTSLSFDLDETRPSNRPRKRRLGSRLAGLLLTFAFLLGLYFLFPWRTNLLVLGIDRTSDGANLGRSDTIMLLGIEPLRADVKMLSIPRDLWVTLPQFGENRINAAHYFAEIEEPGSGPQASLTAVENNFNVDVDYFVRIRLEGFAALVNALGGVDISLSESAAGYPAGIHQLDGDQALAFVRDRQGDDFFRMANGQIFIRALGKKLLSPTTWLQLPASLGALNQSLDSNVPFWLWPRLAFTLLRAGPDGIDSQTLSRTMATPWTTDAGAQVLLPNWEEIGPLVREMFGDKK